MTKTWTMAQLKQELRGFEAALKARGLRTTSIQTSVGQSERFLRWLDGEYEPRGANAVGRSRWSKPGRQTAAPGRIERSHGTPGRIEIVSNASIEPFDWKWPSGNVEQFERGWDLEVTSGGRSHTVRHAITVREAFGRARVRSVTWVDGKPTVEGVETETYGADRSLASLLKINGAQHVRALSEVPAGYRGFDVVAFNDVVTGDGVFRGLSVRIADDDVEKWARHALLRSRSKAR